MAQNVSFCLFSSVTLSEALVRFVPELVVAAIDGKYCMISIAIVIIVAEES
ncbi:unnamed protein product [Sphenostylis stenocarpa]|uniref:Uncharacterized protein n=1 Tax=Sphenostylis stenocarpa TaxID=92480 RepID=A0AA86TBN3_9FABA|nr:unnamed protein product [Sphenostylis stenocarpa]